MENIVIFLWLTNLRCTSIQMVPTLVQQIMYYAIYIRITTDYYRTNNKK